MNFYEELGLSPSATLEEIRQAHRVLARLLHPDQYQDDGVRRIAEAQMKRLNEVYGVLSDAQARRHYDQSLHRGQTLVPAFVAEADPGQAAGERFLAARVVEAARRNGTLCAAIALSIGLIYWILSSQTARHRPMEVQAATQETSARMEAARPESRIPQSRIAESGTPRRQSWAPAAKASRAKNEFSEEAARQQEPRRLTQAEQTHPQEAVTAFVPQPAPAAMAGGEEAQSEAPGTKEGVSASGMAEDTRRGGTAGRVKQGLSGTWVYLPERFRKEDDELYPPEFIEVVIVETEGMLHGRYQARFRVLDRAISPNVRFQFGGKRSETGHYHWTGGGGSRGEVRLKLISEKELGITWFASNLGRDMGLSSGTAVLVRRLEP